MTSASQTNFSIADARLNEAALKALGAAHEVSAHKCKKLGIMTLSYANQPSIEVQILPGHQSDHLDFVYQGKYYTGPGKEFHQALKEAR
jgi:fumarate hydratase class II